MEVSPSFALLFLFFSALTIMAAECKQENKPPATQPDDDDDDDDGDAGEAATETAKKSLGRGFGDDVDWVEWDNAVSVALDVNKPIFLLVHKTWCGACTALKNSFKSSAKRGKFVELSKQFVMVNTEDDEEPEDDEYAPDGRYIPRLYFLDKKGNRLAVDNKKNYANNAHYFPQVIDVIRGMKKALKLYEKQQAQQDANEPEKPPSKTSSKKMTEKNAEETEGESPDSIKVPKTLINEELIEDQPPIDENHQEQQGQSEQENNSLGEIYVSDEELSMMESGGCPHAAAARAAAQAAEQAEEKDKQEAKSSKKNLKKESGDEKKSEKKNAKKQKSEL